MSLDYLFIYGTLEPGQAPAEIAGAVRRLRPVGQAMVRGLLYDLGQYPGAVLDESSKSAVHGKLYKLPTDPHLIREIDEYEGYDRERPHQSLFVRRKCDVILSDGTHKKAWIYEYNRDPGNAPMLPSGSYPAFSSK